MVRVAGSNAVTAAGGAATLTVAEAVLPFKLAVMPAWPSASVPTTTGAVVCPARTVTCAAIDTMPAGGADSGAGGVGLLAAEIGGGGGGVAPRGTADGGGKGGTTGGRRR